MVSASARSFPSNGHGRRPTVSIMGAGKSGAAIARGAIAAGYKVAMAASTPAASSAMMIDIVAPGARAVNVIDVADAADVVILAVPLRRFRDLPLDLLAGRTVVDLMNYWPPIDGFLPEFERGQPSSTTVQAALPPTARLVKTFNHLGYHQLEDLARPPGAAHRIALGLAGDESSSVATVSELIDRIGFAPVAIGGLADSAVLQPGSPVFGAALEAAEMRRILAINETEAA
ncbi:MAG: oxidoreductase coenzyme F420-dependent [Acidimicrobiia bacterium]|nr:oxidoreductase coenzyme F420-dependent [Acidimicrobiia bacterium]